MVIFETAVCFPTSFKSHNMKMQFFICNRGKCWEARCKQRKKTMDRVLQTVHVMAVEEKQLCWSEYLMMKTFLIGWMIFNSW